LGWLVSADNEMVVNSDGQLLGLLWLGLVEKEQKLELDFIFFLRNLLRFGFQTFGQLNETLSKYPIQVLTQALIKISNQFS